MILYTYLPFVQIGLCAQLVFFTVFVLVACSFQFRFQRHATSQSTPRPWKKHLARLYAVSVLIFARSLVRLVEYIQGNNGYIISHEAFLYVFDASVILLAVVVMSWIHPGEVAKHVRELQAGDEESKDRVVLLDNMSA